MSSATIGSIVVAVHTAADPDDQAWQQHIKNVALPALSGVLVVTEGGGPSAAQRRDIRDIIGNGGSSVPTAIVTDAKAVHLLITAFSWFGVKIRAFPKAEMTAALEFLGVGGFVSSRIILSVHAMRRELGL